MIAALWATTTIAVVVAVAALALALLLARRFRELHQLISERPAIPYLNKLPKIGTSLPAFHADAVDGSTLSDADLRGADVTVAFVMVDCEPCAHELPALLRALETGRLGSDPVAVVVGSGEGRAAYLDALAPVARVVTEEFGGAVTSAFGVTNFPTIVAAGDGRIRRAGTRVAELELASA